MKVAVDLEEVLVESNRVFIDELQKFVERKHPESGEEFDVSHIQGWKFQGIRERFAEIRGWEKDIEDQFLWGDGNGWEGFFPVTEQMWRTEPSRFPPALDDPARQLTRMRQGLPGDSEIHMVTGRENAREMILERLRQLEVLELMDGVTVEKQKHRLEFDFYIDDHPQLHSRLDHGIQIMVDCPWNRHVVPEKPHVRVSNLHGAVEVVQNREF